MIRSDGTFRRDYIYIRDVVDGYLRLADSLEASGVQGEAFNFSLESPSSVLEIVSRLQHLMDCTDVVPDIRNEAVGEIRDQYLAAGKARQRLDWTLRYSLEDGLREASRGIVRSSSELAMLRDLPLLVTGGAGFVGAALVRRLVAVGARVSVITRGRLHTPDGSPTWRMS